MKILAKNRFKLFIILTLIFTTTGCVKYNEEMRIHGTKSMDINIDFAIDKSIVEYDFDDNKIKQLKDKGYKIDKYKSGDYTGITLKYKVRNIDKVSTTSDTVYSLTDIRNNVPDKMFKIKKSWFKNYYKANFIFDSTDIDPIIVNDEEKESIEYLCDDGNVIVVRRGEEIKEGCHRAFDYELENAKSKKPMNSEKLEKKINKNTDLKFVVKLNKKAISHNASNSKQKKELIWNLKQNGITTINFEFSLYNYFHIFITLIIIVVVVGVIILFIKKFLIRKKKKK